MDILIDLRQRFARFLAQVGGPLRDIDEVLDQRGELVSGRDAEVAHSAFGMALAIIVLPVYTSLGALDFAGRSMRTEQT